MLALMIFHDFMDCMLLWAYEMSYCTVWVVLLDCCTREQLWALVFLPKQACLA